MKFSRILVVFLLAVLAAVAPAQFSEKVIKWSAQWERPETAVGEWNRIILTAVTDEGYHIYGAKPMGEGPVWTSIKAEGTGVTIGELVEPPAFEKIDEGFNIPVTWHDGEVKFAVPVKLDAAPAAGASISLSVTYQACTTSSCLRASTTELKVPIVATTAALNSKYSQPDTSVPDQPNNKSMAKAAGQKKESPSTVSDSQSNIQKAKTQGLWAYVGLAFTAGLLALITPCVFPMIPITVSFFTKKVDESGKLQWKGPLAYSLGIIVSFTLVGVLMTVAFGAAGIQQLATNPIVNIFLAALFIVLALSLFGVFELQLPSGFVNKFHKGSKTGGLMGPILMGVTFSLTTFTCTVPFVGTVLIGATQGDYLYPILGMLAFSSAFALPFFILALFPQWLGKLPKSGSWLATVKAFMGFLELAAALKFISNVDLVYTWGLITRPVFLSIWATILVVAGLYLMGTILLGHAPEKPVIGWGRRAFGLASFAGAIYCLAGMQGANLGSLGAFLPPDPYPGKEAKGPGVDGLAWSKSYEESLAKGVAENKLVFLDFTGVTCTNCRWVEQNIFTDPEVSAELKKFSLAKLYTDRPTDADRANFNLQKEITGEISLPIYVIMDPATKKAKKIFAGSDTTPKKFAEFLRSGFGG
jgi:thiol:disulfide interchange protein